MSYDLKIIQEVKHRPYLYDTNDCSYQDKRMRAVSWKAISDTIGVEADECHRRWRSLRDRYCREKKSMEVSGHAKYGGRRQWHFFQELQFLDSYIRHRKAKTYEDGEPVVHAIKDEGNNGVDDTCFEESNPVPDDKLSDMGCELECEDSRGDTSDCAPSSDTPTPEPVKPAPRLPPRLPSAQQPRKRTKLCPEDELIGVVKTMQAAIVDLLKGTAAPAPTPPCEDEDDTVGRSIAATLKKMTPRKKLTAKAKLFQALLEVETEAGGE